MGGREAYEEWDEAEESDTKPSNFWVILGVLCGGSRLGNFCYVEVVHLYALLVLKDLRSLNNLFSLVVIMDLLTFSK